MYKSTYACVSVLQFLVKTYTSLEILMFLVMHTCASDFYYMS